MRASLFLLVLLAAPAFAVTFETPLPDPAREAAAQRVIHQLKCVVCEGQSLAESDAPFAHQMRLEIRRQIGSGLNEAEAVAYFRERYGDRILLTPPFSPATYMLWFAPLLLVVAGIGLWARAARKVRHD